MCASSYFAHIKNRLRFGVGRSNGESYRGAYPHYNSMSAHTTHSAGDFSESKISSKNKSLNLYTDYSHALSLVQLPVARTNDTSLVISANSQRARGSSNECCCLKKIALKSAMQNA